MESHAVFFHLNLKMQFSVPVRLEYMYSCPYCFPKFPLTKDMPIFWEEKKKKIFLGKCFKSLLSNIVSLWRKAVLRGCSQIWGREGTHNVSNQKPCSFPNVGTPWTIQWRCVYALAEPQPFFHLHHMMTLYQDICSLCNLFLETQSLTWWTLMMVF